MATTNEYLTSNRYIRYPFADDSYILPLDSSESTSSSYPAEDFVDDEASMKVFGCFVDAIVQLKSPFLDVTPVVTDVSVSGSSLSFTLCGLLDEERTVLTCTRSTTAFPVISGSNSWCWFTFVLSSEGIKEYSEISEKIGDVRSCVLRFNARCIGMSSYSVSSFLVYGGQKPYPSNRYKLEEALMSEPDCKVTGDVAIREGYNIQLGDSENGWSIDQSTNCISLSAGAGLGAGKIVCSDSSPGVVFKTPGLISKDGHVRVFNDTCYDTEPWVYVDPGEYSSSSDDTKNGELHFSVKCNACCSCTMYESIVNGRLIPLRDKILESKGSLEETLSTYTEYAKKWNERIENAYPEDIVVTSTGVALDAAATDLDTDKIKGRMNRCGFSLLMRNDSFVDVTFNLVSFAANGDPFESQIGYMNDSMLPVVEPVDLGSGASPIFSIVLPPGRTANLTYFVRTKKMVTTDEQSGFMASATISAYQGSRLVTTIVKDMVI